MSSPYGYGGRPQDRPLGPPPGVLPPPQAAPWPPPGSAAPGQYAPPQVSRTTASAVSAAAAVPGSVGAAVLRRSGPVQRVPAAAAAGRRGPAHPARLRPARCSSAGRVAVHRRRCWAATRRQHRPARVTGPSIVPTREHQPAEGLGGGLPAQRRRSTAAVALPEQNCKAANLGNGSLAAQKVYYQKLFTCLNDAWRPIFKELGQEKPDPGLVVFDKPVTTPCGSFAAAVRPGAGVLLLRQPGDVHRRTSR